MAGTGQKGQKDLRERGTLMELGTASWLAFGDWVKGKWVARRALCP